MATMVEILGHPCVLGDRLGAGGMGCVYAAFGPTGARLAVKLLHEELRGDPAMVRRMRNEARAVRRISHRNVVRVVDAGETVDGVEFVAMERVAGVPLGALVQREGPLPLGRLRGIADQILGGLAAVHGAGLLHGDMKSDNVLVDTACDDRVTIIDFGLARPTSCVPHATTQRVSGTPDYMAPEVIRGEPATPAADLYAVGVILYEMATGSTPFGGGSTTAIFERQLADDVTPPSLRCPDRALSPVLEAVILRALAKEPSARFPDAAALAAALDGAVPQGAIDRAAASGPPAFSTTAPTRDWNRPTEPRAQITAAARPA